MGVPYADAKQPLERSDRGRRPTALRRRLVPEAPFKVGYGTFMCMNEGKPQTIRSDEKGHSAQL